MGVEIDPMEKRTDCDLLEDNDINKCPDNASGFEFNYGMGSQFGNPKEVKSMADHDAEFLQSTGQMSPNDTGMESQFGNTGPFQFGNTAANTGTFQFGNTANTGTFQFGNTANTGTFQFGQGGRKKTRKKGKKNINKKTKRKYK